MVSTLKALPPSPLRITMRFLSCVLLVLASWPVSSSAAASVAVAKRMSSTSTVRRILSDSSGRHGQGRDLSMGLPNRGLDSQLAQLPRRHLEAKLPLPYVNTGASTSSTASGSASVRTGDRVGALARAAATSCSDLLTYCASWSTQYCGAKWYYQGLPVASYWCPKSCNICSSSGGARPPPSPPPPSPPPPRPPPPTPSPPPPCATCCSDVSPYCGSWGTKYCDPSWTYNNLPVGTYWCPKTCNTCQGKIPPPPPPPSSPSPPKGSGGGFPPPPRSPPPSPPPPPLGGGSTCNDQCDYNRQLLQLVNNLRASLGLSSLCLNNKLIAASKVHSIEMFNTGKLQHDSPDGTSFSQRITRAGFSWTGAAENVAQGYMTPSDVFTGWKNSPGHYANMIGQYNYMGAYIQGQFYTLDLGKSSVESCNN